MIFNERGRGDVVAGLNQTTVDLDLLDVQEGYDGYIGADGNPLIISANTVLYRGQGSMTYQDGNGTTDLMIVDSSNLQDAVQLTGSTITRLRVRRGKATVLASFTGTFTDVEMASRLGGRGAVVEVAAGANLAITNLYLSGGDIFGDINIGLSTLFVVSGGSFETALGQSAITASLILTGGSFTWSPVTSNVATVPTWSGLLQIMAGTFDARLGMSKTMSDVRVWDAGTFLYGPGDSVTLKRMKP